MIRTAGAKYIGSYHTDNYLPCQDAVYFSDNLIGLIAVSDGAGSVPGSEEYSQFAVEKLSEYVEKSFKNLYELAEEEMRIVFLYEARKLFGDAELPFDFAYCTFVLFATNEKGEWLSIHVGDGGIFADFGDGMAVLSAPENGNTESETYFLKSCKKPEHLRIKKGKSKTIKAVVTTDGCWYSLYSHMDEKPADAVDIIPGWLKVNDSDSVSKAIENQLQSLFSTVSDDDLSIACLYKEEMTDE